MYVLLNEKRRLKFNQESRRLSEHNQDPPRRAETYTLLLRRESRLANRRGIAFVRAKE